MYQYLTEGDECYSMMLCDNRQIWYEKKRQGMIILMAMPPTSTAMIDTESGVLELLAGVSESE